MTEEENISEMVDLFPGDLAVAISHMAVREAPNWSVDYDLQTIQKNDKVLIIAAVNGETERDRAYKFQPWILVWSFNGKIFGWCRPHGFARIRK